MQREQVTLFFSIQKWTFRRRILRPLYRLSHWSNGYKMTRAGYMVNLCYRKIGQIKNNEHRTYNMHDIWGQTKTAGQSIRKRYAACCIVAFEWLALLSSSLFFHIRFLSLINWAFSIPFIVSFVAWSGWILITAW